MSLTTLVLAAGQGRRFGSESKLLAPLAGRAVLGRVFDRLAEAGLDTGFVALPDNSRFSALQALVPVGFDAVPVDQNAIVSEDHNVKAVGLGGTQHQTDVFTRHAFKTCAVEASADGGL